MSATDNGPFNVVSTSSPNSGFSSEYFLNYSYVYILGLLSNSYAILDYAKVGLSVLLPSLSFPPKVMPVEASILNSTDFL